MPTKQKVSTRSEERTYLFKCFKQEFSLTSKLYWHFYYSTSVAADILSTKCNSYKEYISDCSPIEQFENESIHIKVNEFIDSSEDYIAFLRMLLLIKACAALEEYIHSYAKYYASFLGLRSRMNKLNEVGEAIVRPSMVSNIWTSAKYIQGLIGVNLSMHLDILNTAYKIRCAVAHNGGIIDSEVARKIPALSGNKGERIKLEWDELKSYIGTIHAVAKIIEQNPKNKEIRKAELEWIVQDIIDEENSITAKKISKLLKQKYKMNTSFSVNHIVQSFGVRKG